MTSHAERSNTGAADHSRSSSGATEHSADMEVEFALEIIIPFLANSALGLTMRGHKPGRIPVTIRGEHVHTWCQPCADLPQHCHGVHEECSECNALRTLSLLSVRWQTFCWEQLPRRAEY